MKSERLGNETLSTPLGRPSHSLVRTLTPMPPLPLAASCAHLFIPELVLKRRPRQLPDACASHWQCDPNDCGLPVLGTDASTEAAAAVVTTLDLSSNSIGPEGAQAIAEVLKANAVLAVLWLTDNSIGEDGARAIAEALKVNTAVTTLRLMSNDIGVEGAIAIAEALKVNKVLADGTAPPPQCVKSGSAATTPPLSPVAEHTVKLAPSGPRKVVLQAPSR